MPPREGYNSNSLPPLPVKQDNLSFPETVGRDF